VRKYLIQESTMSVTFAFYMEEIDGKNAYPQKGKVRLQETIQV